MGVPAGDIEEAVDVLVDGGVVAFPTETVYGLGALASRGDAVERVFEMKGRPRSRALIVHLDGWHAVETFAKNVPPYARQLAEAFWPGPLTLVFERCDTVLDEVTGGGETVAMRVPDHPVALALIERVCARLGRVDGIAAPSANRFGEPPATSAQEVVRNLGAPGSGPDTPDLILDAGACPGRVPSTILSCAGPIPRLLRRGSLSPEAIEEVLGRHIDQ